MFRPDDPFEDFACRLCSDEGFRVGIVVLQVFHNGALELDDALKGAAADAISGDLGEEALDHVKPGRRCWREVQMKAGMRFDPALHGRGFVSSVVVNDEMEIKAGGGLLVDQFEKVQELAMSMARHASPNDGAVQHVECREQHRGTVAFVVVGHRPGAPFLHGQAWLGAIEGLDLALFIDTEDQRLSGGLR